MRQTFKQHTMSRWHLLLGGCVAKRNYFLSLYGKSHADILCAIYATITPRTVCMGTVMNDTKPFFRSPLNTYQITKSK